MYLLLFNRNICCCSKEIFFAVQKIYLLLSKWKTWSEQLQSFSCSWPAGLRVVCSPPVAALQYHCCMDQPSRVKDRHWQRTIWRRQWEIDNNSSIQDLRRRFESVTQFWGWAALTTHVRLVALLLPLLLSNLSPLFDAGNNHCYLLPPPHICFLPCCCCKKIGQAILPVLLGGFPGTELKSQVGFQGGKCRRFVDLRLEPDSNPG